MAYKKNKVLIEEYMEKVCEYSSYKPTKPFDVIRLSDGSLVVEHNDSIQTKFCFGWSNLWPQKGSVADARKEAHDCRHNPEHFLRENIMESESRMLNYRNNGIQLIHYWGIEELDVKLAYPIIDGEVGEGAEEVTDPSDLEKIRRLIEAQHENFKKRLNSYLKRYGLSKLDVWTFCMDD